MVTSFSTNLGENLNAHASQKVPGPEYNFDDMSGVSLLFSAQTDVQFSTRLWAVFCYVMMAALDTRSSSQHAPCWFLYQVTLAAKNAVYFQLTCRDS